MATGIAKLVFEDDGTFPNSPLPVMIYRQAIAPDRAGPEAMEQLFSRHGWRPQWRASIFNYHHYHSKAHEGLGIAAGRATVMLGGPDGQELPVAAGDVVVIPAGVAHKRIVASADFLVVGAYPPGEENWDTLRGAPDDRPHADRNIARLPVPENDPVEGGAGELVRTWTAARPARKPE